ncbi:YrhK family protein [Paenibacillus sp. Marseille-Q7038]
MKGKIDTDIHKEKTSNNPSGKKKRFRINLHRKKHSLVKKRIETRNRYETVHVASEIVTAILYLVGSFFLFYPDLKVIGSIMFILGSIQMLVRALIRMSYMVKLRKWDYRDRQSSVEEKAQTDEEAYLNSELK